MADPLSITSAVVGFVAFTLDVAKTATQFVQDAKGFPDEFMRLSLDTNEFAILIRRLAPTIEKVEARFKNSEGSIRSRANLSLIYSKRRVSHLEAIPRGVTVYSIAVGPV